MYDSNDVLNPLLTAKINADLEQFAANWKSGQTVSSPAPVDAFCDVMLRGGKRMRGQLAMQSYFAHGGTNEAVAIGAARVFEIIQTSLLIVDDIADRSRLRRGGPAAHVQLEAFANEHAMKGSARHYGQVQTMNIAYAGLHKATTELLELPVGSDVARAACARFHENILTTINGQIDDIYNEATPEIVSESAIESVMERKTAYYSFLSPIELGACLAGAVDITPDLRDYSLHAGCAFQIADDIIGTFGAESETGKGTNDDIYEGKLTLLVHFALSHGTAGQKKQLTAVLGNEAATTEECNKVRAIFKTTGALEYAYERLRVHEALALKALQGDTTTDPGFISFLSRLGDYLVNRKA